MNANLQTSDGLLQASGFMPTAGIRQLRGGKPVVAPAADVQINHTGMPFELGHVLGNAQVPEVVAGAMNTCFHVPQRFCCTAGFDLPSTRRFHPITTCKCARRLIFTRRGMKKVGFCGCCWRCGKLGCSIKREHLSTRGDGKRLQPSGYRQLQLGGTAVIILELLSRRLDWQWPEPGGCRQL